MCVRVFVFVHLGDPDFTHHIEDMKVHWYISVSSHHLMLESSYKHRIYEIHNYNKENIKKIVEIEIELN